MTPTQKQSSYTPSPGGAVYRVVRSGIPTPFIIITIIVGALWYVWQIGGFNFFQQEAPTPAAIFPDDIVFLTRTPIVEEGGSELFGIVSHSRDEMLGSILQNSEDLFITDAALSAERDQVLVASNMFGGATSTLEVVTLATGARTVVDDGVHVLFKNVVWSGDGSAILYTRAKPDPNADGDDALNVILEAEMVWRSLTTGEEVVMESGMPLALSSDGQTLIYMSKGNLMIGVVRGTQKIAASFAEDTIVGGALSPNGEHFVLLTQGAMHIFDINFERNEVAPNAVFAGAYRDIIFNEEGEALLQNANGDLVVSAFFSVDELAGGVYSLPVPVTPENLTLLGWITHTEI